MKRIANYLIAMAIMAFTFTSCEDVPSPFGEIVKPSSGDVIKVDPTGTGTEADPYNVAAVLEYLSGLGADVQSPNEVFIKGIISEVSDIDVSGTYGNATYYISDDADGSTRAQQLSRLVIMLPLRVRLSTTRVTPLKLLPTTVSSSS